MFKNNVKTLQGLKFSLVIIKKQWQGYSRASVLVSFQSLFKFAKHLFLSSFAFVFASVFASVFLFVFVSVLVYVFAYVFAFVLVYFCREWCAMVCEDQSAVSQWLPMKRLLQKIFPFVFVCSARLFSPGFTTLGFFSIVVAFWGL